MNISIKVENLLEKPSFYHPAYMPNKMNQCRMLFYIKSIKFLNLGLAENTELYL